MVTIQHVYAISCRIGSDETKWVNVKNVEKARGIALIIGNIKYKSGKLQYPVKDAISIKNHLKSLEFLIVSFENLRTGEDFNDITRAFKNCLIKIEGLVVFFYFSGYGAYVKNINYLIPANDSKIKDRADIKTDAFPVSKLFDRLEEVNSKLNIIILDACRKHPQFDFSEGLGEMAYPKNSIVAYPTEYGETIAPVSHNFRKKEENSLYVKHFVKELKRANEEVVDVRDTIGNIWSPVYSESMHKQSPDKFHSSLNINIKFCWSKKCPSIIWSESNINGSIKIVAPVKKHKPPTHRIGH